MHLVQDTETTRRTVTGRIENHDRVPGGITAAVTSRVGITLFIDRPATRNLGAKGVAVPRLEVELGKVGYRSGCIAF
jgi:hypothetical protein